MTNLLALITTVDLPAIKTFDVSKHFTTDSKTVKIGYIGSDFRENFQGKQERDIKRTTLHIYQLEEEATDHQILAELGGQQATVQLAHLWQLLMQQPNGEDGILLTNRYNNIFYVEDMASTVWAFYCYWSSVARGWGLDAGPVTCPHPWSRGDRVLSRGALSLSPPQTLSHSGSLTLDSITIGGVKFKLVREEE